MYRRPSAGAPLAGPQCFDNRQCFDKQINPYTERIGATTRGKAA
jgi:hypothetical protein